jgi:CubicO group peptidase (beta-lactamase class C family)
MRRFVADGWDTATLARQRADAPDPAIMCALVYNDTRGLVPHRIERSTEHEIAVLARAKLTDEWFRINMHVAAEPAHGITAWGIRAAPQPADARPRSRMTETEVAGALEEFLDTLVGADLFSGAVLVAKNGAPIFKQAYSLASKAFDVPNRVDTKFNLGSMNKMFTAEAVAQLAERGRLSFGDPVGKHLPDYPSKQVAEKVTIHHLLTHTSGMGSYWNEKFEASKNRLRTVQDFIPLFADDALAFEPGEKFHYSNAGFIVLGAIVEAVSGQSYFDYVREQIYTPAGMHDTDAYEMDRDVPNLAIGYTHTGVNGRPELGPRLKNLFLHVVKGGPAGGGFSTVEDLLRFDIAVRTHRLLGPEYADIVLTGKVEVGAGPDVQYAYGFQAERVNGTRIVGHGGGFPGINGQLDMYLDLGYTVAVLSNYDPPAAGRVAKKLREMVT